MSSRVVQVTGRGGPEVLEVVERALPEPGRGEVRIAVEAAGVAYADAMRRRGLMAPRRPFTPGYDAVGTVEAAGASVDGRLVGSRAGVLMPTPGIGGYAHHVCVPAERLVRVPTGVDAAEAVCLGLNYVTAYQLVHRFVPLRAGQRVLIHGAAGGVGTALCDMGRAHGLLMYGTASVGKHALVRERGATPIDYRSEDFVARIAELTNGAGVDAVFDPIGGAHLRRSYRALARDGTLVSYGVSGTVERGLSGLIAGMVIFSGLKLRFDRRRVRLYLSTVSRGASWRHCRDDWATLLALLQHDELRPVVGARIPLAEVRRAHELIEAAALTGKIVLVP